eukprot:TRINITY_DN54902_c0_g1_i1.p2 TRINITY_DN54902_c0_g1~~TRINITY_DN54902_c0_g1_i1.p2  ORF type:complete len:164 (+),score=26.19 TRINITY_DN54902_c0_g1_i1:178-669(+)
MRWLLAAFITGWVAAYCTDTRCGGTAHICCEGSPALQKKDMCVGSVDCDSCCGWIDNNTNPCQANLDKTNATLATYLAGTKRFTYQICSAKSSSFPEDMDKYLHDHNLTARVRHDVCPSTIRQTDVCSQYFGVWYYFLKEYCPNKLRQVDPDWTLASLTLKCN